MARKRSKKVQTPILRTISVESRPLGENEKIKPGTLLTQHDRNGKEWFLVATGGFGMNPTPSRKIIGPIGLGMEDLKRNIERNRKEHQEFREAAERAGGEEFSTTILTDINDSPIGYFYRTADVRVVTTKVKLDLTDIV